MRLCACLYGKGAISNDNIIIIIIITKTKATTTRTSRGLTELHVTAGEFRNINFCHFFYHVMAKSRLTR